MPTEKRARQKAARRQKRAAQVRKERLRKRLRSGALVVGGAAVVILVVLATTTHIFGGGSSPTTSKSASSTTTTTSATSAKATTDAKLQSEANAAAVAAGCKATPHARANTLHWSSPPATTITASKTYTATVKTTAGTFTIDLLAKTAPHTVNNFVFLADQGFYNCVIFHRVIPGFMDQTGDPTGTGTGGPGYQFANENLPKSYTTGDVAMANSGPNTNGSQFFIVVPGGGSRLGPTYSLFGTVTSGMSVVEKINAEGNSTSTGVPPKVIQRILSVTIHAS